MNLIYEPSRMLPGGITRRPHAGIGSEGVLLFDFVRAGSLRAAHARPLREDTTAFVGGRACPVHRQ